MLVALYIAIGLALALIRASVVLVAIVVAILAVACLVSGLGFSDFRFSAILLSPPVVIEASYLFWLLALSTYRAKSTAATKAKQIDSLSQPKT